MGRKRKLVLTALVTAAFAGCNHTSGVSDSGMDTDTVTDTDASTDTDTDAGADTETGTDFVEVPEGWDKGDVPEGYLLSAVWVSPSGAAYFTAIQDEENPRILRYDGASWSVLEVPPLTPYAYQSIWGRADDDIYVGIGDGTVLHFDGETWTTTRSLNHFSDVWVATDGTTYVVGNRVALRYADGIWTDITDPAMEDLRAVWGCDSDNVFAVGVDTAGATAFRWDGATWQAMEIAATGYLLDIWGSSCTDVYAVDGGIWHFDGSTWSAQPYDTYSFYDSAILSVSGTSGVDVYAVGTGTGWEEGWDEEPVEFEAPLVMHNDGSGWIEIEGEWLDSGSIRFESVWNSSPDDAYFLDGSLYHYDGISGTLSDDTVHGVEIWGAAADDIYTVGYGGEMHHFDGGAWSIIDSGTPNHLYGIWGDGLGYAVAVGPWETVTSTDGGGTWVEQSGDHTLGVVDMDGDAEDVYGFGNGLGYLTRFDGASWEEVEIPGLSGQWVVITGVWSGSAGLFASALGYDPWNAGIDTGSIARFTGDTWELADLPTIEDDTWGIEDIKGLPSGEVVAVGFRGSYGTRTGIALWYDGIDWTAQDTATDEVLWGVWGASNDDVYAIGSEKALAHFDGSIWTSQKVGASALFDIDGSGPDNIYVLGASASEPGTSYLIHKSVP